jgi:hypothetical protein
MQVFELPSRGSASGLTIGLVWPCITWRAGKAAKGESVRIAFPSVQQEQTMSESPSLRLSEFHLSMGVISVLPVRKSFHFKFLHPAIDPTYQADMLR